MLSLCLALLLQTPAPQATDAPVERPNILWLSFEDHGPQLGCYGDEYAETPALDSLAARGVRYERCWSNAPVCSTARTTLITGRYATSLGAHHHRSRLACPEDVRFFPQLLREAGYFCTNNRKEDYNLAKPKGTWDMSGNQAHWRKRADGQPFFAVFNFTVSHESQIRKRPHELKHDPDAFELPPYYPDLPEIRRDWAQEYDKGTEMDLRLGGILKQLREDGLEDDTIIFAFGDHGSGMPRHKRWPGNSGMHVPLIVVIPDKWKHLAPEGYEAGALLSRLVAFVDFGPTVLSLAGIEADAGMQGVPFMGKHDGPAKKYLFGYRGRMDERMDDVRVLTDGRYVYLWNWDVSRPHGAHVDYQFVTPTTKAWYEFARDNPEAPKVIRDYWFNPRGREDLFDLDADPHETLDLVEEGKAGPELQVLREALQQKLIETEDLGFIPEHLLAGMLAEGSAQFDRAHMEAAWRGVDDRKTEDPVLQWWIAFRDWQASRGFGGIPDAQTSSDNGINVARCIAHLQGPQEASHNSEVIMMAWAGLQVYASQHETNYFVRLLAWQALDEAICGEPQRKRQSKGMLQALKQAIAEIDTDHSGLDNAFRNYIPRLKEKVLREFDAAIAVAPEVGRD